MHTKLKEKIAKKYAKKSGAMFAGKPRTPEEHRALCHCRCRIHGVYTDFYFVNGLIALREDLGQPYVRSARFAGNWEAGTYGVVSASAVYNCPWTYGVTSQEAQPLFDAGWRFYDPTTLIGCDAAATMFSAAAAVYRDATGELLLSTGQIIVSVDAKFAADPSMWLPEYFSLGRIKLVDDNEYARTYSANIHNIANFNLIGALHRMQCASYIFAAEPVFIYASRLSTKKDSKRS